MTAALALDWAVALAPVVLVLLLFEWLDVFHLMGRAELTKLLLLGAVTGISAYPLSGRVLDAMPMGFSTYSRFVAPWIEEALKCGAVLLLFARNRVGFKLDAVISGFAVGAGFSIVENAIYLMRFGELELGVWVVRGLGTAVMHGASAGLFAAISQHLNERLLQRPAAPWHLEPARYLPGYLAAVGLHSLFNQFPDRPQLAMLTTLLAVPVLVVLLFRFGEHEAEAWLDAELINHRAALAELRSGCFPETASGAMVAALAQRASGRVTAEAIRIYLELMTELVVRAEEVLRDEGRGAIAPLSDDDRDLFSRLNETRRQLGQTLLAMLAPVLPFTRQDLWELHELEIKLHGQRPTKSRRREAHGSR